MHCLPAHAGSDEVEAVPVARVIAVVPGVTPLQEIVAAKLAKSELVVLPDRSIVLLMLPVRYLLSVNVPPSDTHLPDSTTTVSVNEI